MHLYHSLRVIDVVENKHPFKIPLIENHDRLNHLVGVIGLHGRLYRRRRWNQVLQPSRHASKRFFLSVFILALQPKNG